MQVGTQQLLTGQEAVAQYGDPSAPSQFYTNQPQAEAIPAAAGQVRAVWLGQSTGYDKRNRSTVVNCLKYLNTN